MNKRIKRRKQIGKILALLLASGSFLGISPLTAMAEESSVTITVDVSDSSIPPCTPVEVPATWLPNTSPISETFDLFMSPPETQGFTVSLGFSDGYDPGCDTTYEPTGTISSSFVPNADTGLVLASMECLDAPCDAATISNDGSGGELSGAFNIPQTTGRYDGTLTITWTP